MGKNHLTFGIDPGKSGGIVALNRTGNVYLAEKMPLLGKNFDYGGWASLVLHWMSDARANGVVIRSIWIERTFAAKGRHEGSHEFGRVTGAQLIGAHMLCPGGVTEVQPQTWRSQIGIKKLDVLEDWHAAEKAVVRKIFPRNPELAEDQGLTAAALIAYAAQAKHRYDSFRAVRT